jgi:ketosteroid isomerase-like protein
MSADFKQTLREADDALDRIWKGDAEGYKALFSRRQEITLGNPFGGVWHGWDEVIEQIERAASYFRDGEAAPTEIITQVVEGDLAYVVAIERGNTKVGGQSETSDIALRVTTIYRREDDRWRLVHRHADTRVGHQPAEAILST